MFLSFLIQTYHFVSVCPARLSCFIFALFICMDGIDFQLVRGACASADMLIVLFFCLFAVCL